MDESVKPMRVPFMRPGQQFAEDFIDKAVSELQKRKGMKRDGTGVKPGSWLNSLSSAERKEVAIYRGLFAYFPDAVAAVARHSCLSNEKHNPGAPMYWSREKSSDHLDCIGRHLVNAGSFDADGARHSVCLAWRALANLQLEIEEAYRNGDKV